MPRAKLFVNPWIWLVCCTAVVFYATVAILLRAFDLRGALLLQLLADIVTQPRIETLCECRIDKDWGGDILYSLKLFRMRIVLYRDKKLT